MKSQDNFSKAEQSQKVDLLHHELRQWQSNLRFMQDEMIFLDRLLTSYVFQPTTPNLFERIQDYLDRLQKTKREQTELRKLISDHEASLGGMMECTDTKCDIRYYQQHTTIKTKTVQCLKSFQQLKWEIFNYAGGILKKNKPKSPH